MMIKKVIRYFLFILLFIVSVGKIKAEPLTAGSYKIGDEITYNGMNFYVIADSEEKQDYVTMLKAEPLTVDEINKYGVGHINRYTMESVGTPYNLNGYGGISYYSSTTCGYVNSSYASSGCTNDYIKSEVKYTVDAWAADKMKSADLKVDSMGYSARLLTLDELQNNLGYNHSDRSGTSYILDAEYTPSWVYDLNFSYWTMSQYDDYVSRIWIVGGNGNLYFGDIAAGRYYNSVLRPVVTLKKVVESDKLQPEDNEVNSNNSDKESSNTIQKVDVPDTKKNKIILFSIIGFSFVIGGLIILYLVFKNKNNNHKI